MSEPTSSRFQYVPEIMDHLPERELRQLLVSGPLVDDELNRRVVVLDELFAAYCRTVPFGLWGPGMVVNNEMRAMTELYLPLSLIRRVFNRFFACALAFSFRGDSLFEGKLTWLDVLSGFPAAEAMVHPGRLLRCLMLNETARRRFLFAMFVPLKHGGAFGRYHLQGMFLRQWLSGNRKRLRGEVRMLDAACGSGEGTYDLAEHAIRSGFRRDRIAVDGASLQPLELFAAARAYFPQDPLRQFLYRQRVRQLLSLPAGPRITFFQEDLTGHQQAVVGPPYDVIVCNGLLGGPMVSGDAEIAAVIAGLSGRLTGGGILLAADRFHGGWKKRLPPDVIVRVMERHGLKVIRSTEGVAAERRC